MRCGALFSAATLAALGGASAVTCSWESQEQRSIRVLLPTTSQVSVSCVSVSVCLDKRQFYFDFEVAWRLALQLCHETNMAAKSLKLKSLAVCFAFYSTTATRS